MAESFGQLAYGTYYEHAGGRSLVSGDQLPLWEALDHRIQAAWEAAGQAVAERTEAERGEGPG